MPEAPYRCNRNLLEQDEKEEPTVFVLLRNDFVCIVLQPRDHLDKVTDEAGNVALENGRVALQDALVHHVRRVILGHNCNQSEETQSLKDVCVQVGPLRSMLPVSYLGLVEGEEPGVEKMIFA